MYKLRSYCRACGLGRPEIPTLKESTAAGAVYQRDQKLVEVFDLGLQPLANDFAAMEGEHAGFAPLKVMWCPRCQLGQLSVEVSPDLLYAHNYLYVTSPSAMMKTHFEQINRELIGECKTPRTVVEIGSNDGALLQFLLANGWKVALGIDPAQNLCQVASAHGLSTLCQYFTPAVAKSAVKCVGHPDLILARHCFCHVNDWREFVVGLEELSGPDTVIAIETPWAHDMLEKREFDTVYHEHLSYLSLQSITYLLKPSPLKLYKVIHYPIHGGAILLILKRTQDPVHESVIHSMVEERCDRETWRSFANESEVKIIELGELVNKLVNEGKTVVGYGASAKSTVWVNACRFTRKQIKFICDSTRGKWYRYSPGSEIPIVDEGALTRELPDYAICFAWNYFSEIYEKEKIFRERGGRWIVPVPQIKIV